MSFNDFTSMYDIPFLQGGGEMGEIIRSFDWPATALGSPETWPNVLKITTGIMLSSKYPMLICWGSDYIQLYNDSFRPINGATKHLRAIGASARDTYAEIWDTIGPMFADVMSGRGGAFCYFDFYFSPIRDENGNIGGLLVICAETTKKVVALNKAGIAHQQLEAAQAETIWQRDRLEQFFMQAPAGICILEGPELVFEWINPLFQQLFPGRELLGKPVLEAIPEAKGQPVWDMLQGVYNTGKTLEGNQLLIPMPGTNAGQLDDRYFNFIYQARKDTNGKVDGILVFTFEVTEMVLGSKELAKTQDSLKMAITAAQLGTFDMDIQTGTLDWNQRCRELFGISHSNIVTFKEDFLNGVHPEDREKVETIVNNVLAKSVSNDGYDYDIEYRTIGAEDQKLRWIRAMGKAYFDENDSPARFVGCVLDITEKKLDELRKNDFIGMVSHELKTPLTSLTAIIQVLNAKLKKSEDVFITGAIDKANIQVKKMSTMINGFLNVSRLESSKILLNRERFDLNDLLTEIIAETELIVSNHKIHFKSGDSVILHADRDKIGSVIANLLSNAVKYSSKGKLIDIKCEIIGDNVHVSVKDEGMGIKPQDKDKLFDRYYRVDNNHTRHISGFGIGLYLSAEIVQRHGGRIWVESESGVGSTFYFSLPITTDL
jgi:two-component system sensor histidine kinase VicK